MKLFVRIFVVTLLATFTLGTVLQASAAAAMSTKMALSDHGGADMDDCGDCPDDGKNSPSCASICAMPLMILPARQEFTAVFDHNTLDASVEPGLSGHSGPPDPYPPRSLILS